MAFRGSKKLKQAKGKIRRFLLTHFRKGYVERQMALRSGTCRQCGKCCKFLFRCPFLIKLEGGMSACSIYERRPGQCAAFPIDERCLAEVDCDCGYTFGPSSAEPADDAAARKAEDEGACRHT